MSKLLIEALERRIPQVTDKESAMAKLSEHVSKGMLTVEEAQRFTDMLYPVRYEDVLDKEGEIIDKVAITERVIFKELKPQPTIEDYILDIDYRLTMREMGL